jgi:nucleotide-binding universal stress UspA family protein
MSTRQGVQETPSSADDEASDRAVVVGVDGSERNRAAVSWAAAEAAVAGRPLMLVHVLDERRVPSPLHRLQLDDEYAWGLLDSVEGELRDRYPDLVVRKDVEVGGVATTLVAGSADQAALVMGRRGHGTLVRFLIGSAALDVASRARVPVVVVPDEWSPDDHVADPVVVGLDRRDAQPAVLQFAFNEARMRGVPLVAAHGRDQPAMGWDPASPGGGGVEPDEHGLTEMLAPYAESFPDVQTSIVDNPGHPVAVLLDEAGPRQLLVLGRHTDRRTSGFPFGSVAHGVLHYADVPVAIVPPGG